MATCQATQNAVLSTEQGLPHQHSNTVAVGCDCIRAHAGHVWHRRSNRCALAFLGYPVYRILWAQPDISPSYTHGAMCPVLMHICPRSCLASKCATPFDSVALHAVLRMLSAWAGCQTRVTGPQASSFHLWQSVLGGVASLAWLSMQLCRVPAAQ